MLGSMPVVRSAGSCAHQAAPLPAAAGSTSGSRGSVGWSDVRHWLWPLFIERWGPWRHHRLGLPEAPYLDCPPGVDLPAPPVLLYGKWASASLFLDRHIRPEIAPSPVLITRSETDCFKSQRQRS